MKTAPQKTYVTVYATVHAGRGTFGLQDLTPIKTSTIRLAVEFLSSFPSNLLGLQNIINC